MNFLVNNFGEKVMSYGPGIKIDLPVKKYTFLKIQTFQKLIAQKVLCFSHVKVSKLDTINSQMVSVNSRMASTSQNLTRASIFEVLSIELRETVNLHLSGTVYNS